MSVRGGIFDCDGTLLDSMLAWNNIGGRYVSKLGFVPDDDLRSKLAVMSLFQGAVYLKERYDMDSSIDEIMAGMNKMVEGAYFNDVQPKPGVIDFLEGMKKRNIPMIIATATEKYLIEAALARLDMRHYFIDVVTCNTVRQGKNKPDIYFSCLEKLGTTIDTTPVFEDALYAMETAKSAGFPLVAVEDRKTHNYRERAIEISDIFVDSWENWEFSNFEVI